MPCGAMAHPQVVGYYATYYFMIGHYAACYFIGNYVSRYLLLGTMHPVICYWELCIPLCIIGYYLTFCFII